MIAVTLLGAFIFTLGLFVHFVSAGQFGDAAKMVVTAFGIFVLLAARLTVHRAIHRAPPQ